MAIYYYATYGLNGLGVYTNYYDSFATRKYLSRYRCKKFRTLREAKKHAMLQYNLYWRHNISYQVHNIDEVPVNDILLVSSLIKK